MKNLLSLALFLFLVSIQTATAQLVTADNFARAATLDLSTSPAPYKWVKLQNQDDPSASYQINSDSSISAYNALDTTHMGGVAWDTLVTDTSQAGIIVTQKGGDGVNGTLFMYFRMNSIDGSAGNGYRLEYLDNPSGIDKIIIQRVSSGVIENDLVSLQREIEAGDTLIVKVQGDKTMKALVYGANGVRDSISATDNTYNPSSWYWWLRGYVFTTPAKFTNYMMGKIPVDTTTPQFGVTPAFLTFGSVGGGGSIQDSVTVQNTGDGILRIASAATSSPDFTVTPSYSTIIAGGSEKFYVTFSPTRSGAIAGTLVFNS